MEIATELSHARRWHRSGDRALFHGMRVNGVLFLRIEGTDRSTKVNALRRGPSYRMAGHLFARTVGQSASSLHEKIVWDGTDRRLLRPKTVSIRSMLSVEAITHPNFVFHAGARCACSSGACSAVVVRQRYRTAQQRFFRVCRACRAILA